MIRFAAEDGSDEDVGEIENVAGEDGGRVGVIAVMPPLRAADNAGLSVGRKVL